MKNKLFPAPHFGREFRFGRELRLAASTVILLGAVAAAQAQSAPPPVDTGNASAPAAAAQDGGDPPTRVARLNYFEGPVTYEPAGATDWSYASLNRPLTTGDQVWVDDKGRSELHIGSTAVRMDALTSLDLVNLSDSIAQLKVLQGTMEVRIRAVDPGSSYEIDTPNLALQITTPGIYRVDVAADGSSTTVSVRDGSATAYGNGGSAQIEANQRINYTGTALQQADGGSTPGNDAFDQWIAARDATEDNAVSAHYVSREVPGYEDLDANGTWSHDPTYGEVWVPHAAVTAGWAPYHEGHWAWVAPWGWTWIDDAPWGFAPFHYGRWAYVHTNWAWVPGPIVVAEPPVYAPALVAFVGGGGGGGVSWGVNLSIGGAIGAGVAWIPLGPGEPWRPAYRSSPGYYNRMNYSPYNHTVNNFNNSTRITNITTVNNTFINRGAPGGISAVPANAFVQGRGVAQAGQTLRPEQIAHAQIGAGSPAIAPVKASFMPNQRIANNHPPQALENRQVVATRAPVTPAAFHDTLAAHYAQSGGRVAGAGEPVIRNAAPAAAGRPGTPIGANAGNRGAAGFQVVPAVRHPVEGAGQTGAGQARPGAPGATAPGNRPGTPAAEGNRPAPAAEANRPAAAEANRAVPGNGVPHPPGAAANQPQNRPAIEAPHTAQQQLRPAAQGQHPAPGAEGQRAAPEAQGQRPTPEAQAQRPAAGGNAERGENMARPAQNAAPRAEVQRAPAAAQYHAPQQAQRAPQAQQQRAPQQQPRAQQPQRAPQEPRAQQPRPQQTHAAPAQRQESKGDERKRE